MILLLRLFFLHLTRDGVCSYTSASFHTKGSGAGASSSCPMSIRSTFVTASGAEGSLSASMTIPEGLTRLLTGAYRCCVAGSRDMNLACGGVRRDGLDRLNEDGSFSFLLVSLLPSSLPPSLPTSSMLRYEAVLRCEVTRSSEGPSGTPPSVEVLPSLRASLRASLALAFAAYDRIIETIISIRGCTW